MNDKIIPIKHSYQHDDGSFDHYVVFSRVAPWDAPDSERVRCASEHEADKLIGLLEATQRALCLKSAG